MNKIKILLSLIALPFVSLSLSFAGDNTKSEQKRTLDDANIHDHSGMTAWTSTNSLPGSAGSYYLTTDVTISSTWYPSGNVTLCLNGHGIRKNGGVVIQVSSGNTLNLTDCDTTTIHKFTVNNPRAENGAGYATVNDGLTSDYKTFTGGYITGGTGSNGAAMVIRGNFNFYGGNIIGNNCATGDGNGSIRMYSPGVFNMYGGSVSYNFGRSGGAVFVDTGSTFNMYDGVISYNNTSVRAGAIFTRGTTSIRGGEITQNWGGEATIAPWGNIIEITGGEIHDNIVGAAGLTVANDFRMGGNPRVYNNKRTNGEVWDIFVNNNAKIKIVEAFDESVKTNKIPIRMNSNTGEFTSGWNTYMSEEYAPYFFTSVNTDYTIGLSNNEVAVGNYHVHERSYSLENNIIKAHCNADDCDLGDQTLSISAEDKLYDEEPVVATLNKSDGWSTRNGLLAIPQIVYSGNTDPGTYTASITVGGLTSSCEFTIQPLHTHDWEFSVEDNVITAHCVADDCDLEDQTLTINATGKTYDGDPVTATVTASANWNEKAGLPAIPDVVYSGNTSVGTHNASITVEGLTASVEFEISPKTDIDIDGVSGDISVDGLNEELNAIIKENPTANNVSLSMKIEEKEQKTAQKGDEIAEIIDNQVLSYFDITLEKTLDEVTTTMSETSTVLEIAFPFEKINKRNIQVYSYHDDEIRTFVESDTKADGTFIINKEDKIVYVYTRSFSTYAIGYTPYYRVSIDLSFGIFKGKINVTLEDKNGETIYKFENVDATNVVFEDVAMGQYKAIVSWAEGDISTSLAFNLRVGPTGVVITPISNN